MFADFSSSFLSFSLTLSKFYKASDLSIQARLISTIQQMVYTKLYVMEAVLTSFPTRQANRATFPSSFQMWALSQGCWMEGTGSITEENSWIAYGMRTREFVTLCNSSSGRDCWICPQRNSGGTWSLSEGEQLIWNALVLM